MTRPPAYHSTNLLLGCADVHCDEMVLQTNKPQQTPAIGASMAGIMMVRVLYNTIQNHGIISSLKCDEIANKSIISP